VTTEIIKEIMKHVPEAKVSDVAFEAANIVLYTKDKKFLFNDEGTVRNAVNAIKKRVELRPDPSITMEQEKAEERIKEILTEAGVDEVIFDPERSMVTIEMEKPGVAIGNKCELLNRIKEETLWFPIVKRTHQEHAD